jgi:hypothetical protein
MLLECYDFEGLLARSDYRLQGSFQQRNIKPSMNFAIALVFYFVSSHMAMQNS